MPVYERERDWAGGVSTKRKRCCAATRDSHWAELLSCCALPSFVHLSRDKTHTTYALCCLPPFMSLSFSEPLTAANALAIIPKVSAVASNLSA